jgi:hypothetical protein
MRTRLLYILIFLIVLPLQSFSQNIEWLGHVKGSTSSDSARVETMAIDANDNIIIGGASKGTIEFVGSVPLQTITSTAANCPFIAKYSGDGTLQWVNKLGGVSPGNVKSVTIDAAGNIYAVGRYRSNLGVFVFSSQDGNDISLSSTGNSFDPFLLKYDPDGNLQWVIPYATSTNVVHSDQLILDADNNLVVSGYFRGATLDFGGSNILTFSGSDNNGFAAKFDLDGNFIWAKHYPGNWVRAESGLALCANEGYFLTLTIKESVVLDGNTILKSAPAGDTYELILIKMDKDGTTEWYRHATTTNNTYGGQTITSDELGNAYLTGKFTGNLTLPNPSGDPLILGPSGGWDNFIAKYNSSGVLLNALEFGGSGEENHWSIDYRDDLLAATGFFASTNLILNEGPSADTLTTEGGRDAYFIDFNKDLTYLTSSSAGGTLNDEGTAVVIDSEGNSIFGGYFKSGTFNIGGSTLINSGSLGDIFIVKQINIQIITSATPISCFGGTDGALEFSISGGGTPPISYTVHLGVDEIASGTYSTPISLTGLVAGAYKITATDANLKSKVKYVQVTQPDQLTATINVTNITTCYGATEGEISITGAAGGYGTYEYSVNGGTNWQSSSLFENLTAGTYHVMIRDAAFTDCEISLDENVEITEPDEIVILPSPTNITCNGAIDGKIEINASGGTGGPYMYSINDGVSFQASNLFEDLPPGSYKIKVDDGVCVKAMPGNVVLSDPDPIVAGTIASEDISCFGQVDGSITVSDVTGGSGPGTYEYSINGINFFENNGVFTGLSANDYDIFIKDNYNCIIQVATVTIDEPSPITIVSVVSVDITSCFGDPSGSITITATGGTGNLSYSIDDGTNWQASNEFTGLGGGVYNILVKDENDCETIWASNPLTIAQPNEIIISDVEEEHISCFGQTDGKITVTASGGTGVLEYSINGTDWQASNVFEDLAKDNYTVYVRDENSCVVQWSVEVEIIEPTALQFSEPQITLETAQGAGNGAISIQLTGGTSPYDYTINPGGATNQTGVFTGLSKNNYTILGVDANGCSLTSDVIVLGIVGIEDIKTSNLKIFPNPSTGQFIVEFNNQLNKELFMRIYNVVGQVVYTKKINPLDTFVREEISLENEARGVYMLQISGTDIMVTKKLILR